jgi:hypothetical protein
LRSSYVTLSRSRVGPGSCLRLRQRERGPTEEAWRLSTVAGHGRGRHRGPGVGERRAGVGGRRPVAS